jgi:Uma2 family endonuclease
MVHAIDGDVRYTAERYFEFVKQGLIADDDHVELLEGIIVAEPPQDPPHATDTTLVVEALRRAVGGRALIRVQMPLVIGRYSVPEPDVAVVPGSVWDYTRAHPTSALLVVEVAASSLPKDRLSKSRIYAAAAIPEYWVINLRDHCVEVFHQPDAALGQYADSAIARHGDRLALVALPGTQVMVDDLLLPETAAAL